jgi:hypothetical protein
MRVAYLIRRVIDTRSKYLTLTAFPLQLKLQERASMLRCSTSSVLKVLLKTEVVVVMAGIFPLQQFKRGNICSNMLF